MTRRRITPDGRPPLHVLDAIIGRHRTRAEIDALIAEGTPYDAFFRFDFDTLPQAEQDALRRRYGRYLP